MSKYKLIKLYPESKFELGNVLVENQYDPCCYCLERHANFKDQSSFKNISKIHLINAPEFWKKIDEIFLFGDEDQVYYKGKKEKICADDFFYSVRKTNLYLNRIKENLSIKEKHEDFFDFKTQKAAKDYVTLQEAINESDLEIGSEVSADALNDWNHCDKNYYSDGSKSWVLDRVYFYGSKRKIRDFKIVDGHPAFSVTDTCESVWLKLKGFKNKKVITFGGEKVELEPIPNENNGKYFYDVKITCKNEVGNFLNLKEFVTSYETVNNFKFGHQVFQGFGKNIQIGCTTGTLNELKNIISECEFILEEKKHIDG